MSVENGTPPQHRNDETQVARDYQTATNHSPESVRAGPHGLDWSNQPRPYKLYADLEPLSLPEPEESDVSALAAIARQVSSRIETRTPDIEMLASILHFSNGITRRLRFPGGSMEFRAAACTGALYHIELYLVCADLPGLEAGVYHFGAHDGALRRLRSGDLRGALVQATGGEPATASAPAALICTSSYWRNAWKYQARTYRHCFWDAGTILANVLAMAAARGLRASVITGFVDEQVNALLDLDDQREVSLALVPLGHNAAPPPALPAVVPLELKTVPYSRSEIDYAAIRAMQAASSLTTEEEVVDWRSDPPAPHPIGARGPVIPLHALEAFERPSRTDASIEQVIRRRGSARQFEPAAIGLEILSTLLRESSGEIAADFRNSPASALSTPYLIVRAVEGLRSGTYVYHQDIQALERLELGDFTEAARHLDLDQDLGAQAAVDVYYLADLEDALAALGNRGYRAAQLDAAIMAGRLYLSAYALGLGATGLTFYDDEVVSFFSPHAQGKSVMFLLALGVPARRRSMVRG